MIARKSVFKCRNVEHEFSLAALATGFANEIFKNFAMFDVRLNIVKFYA